jgi:prepilin-type processing-associated H-X9-DG protein
VIKNLKYAFLISGIFSVLLLLPQKTLAATFSLTPDKDSVSIGDEFIVTIRSDTADIGINAAQATIKFPKDILQVTSLDKTGSVFNFWLEEPSYSNENGEVFFVGGSSAGVSGKSLQIIKIVFKVIGGGSANIVFADGAITASDGSGTNVLTSMGNLTVSSAPKSSGTGASQTTPVKQTLLPPPTQITRLAESAKVAPVKPALDVPLYPDPEKWYNGVDNFLVQWILPSDVSDVSTLLNKTTTYSGEKSEGLFNNKVFPAITGDGIWYVHVRFMNQLGWGNAINYRVAIDTQPPLAFNVTSDEGAVTGNPSPTIRFETSDALSGISNYEIKIGDSDATTTQQTFFKLPIQPPGEHFIKIKAIDKAGNAVESNLELEILPISSPVITSLSANIFIGEGSLELKGTSLPGINVDLVLKQKAGQTVYSTSVIADSTGNWEYKIDQPLKKGKYIVEATARDARGALSLTVPSGEISVKERPIITVAGIDITAAWFLTIFLVLLVIAFGLGWFSVRLENVQRGKRVLIAKRDVDSAFMMINKDIDKVLIKYRDGDVNASEINDSKYILERIKETIGNTEKYITENIGEINDESEMSGRQAIRYFRDLFGNVKNRFNAKNVVEIAKEIKKPEMPNIQAPKVLKDLFGGIKSRISSVNIKKIAEIKKIDIKKIFEIKEKNVEIRKEKQINKKIKNKL